MSNQRLRDWSDSKLIVLVFLGTECPLVGKYAPELNKLEKEFKTLLETTNDKQSISVAATGAALGKLVAGANVPNADAVNGVLQGMDGVSLAITVAKDVQFQIGVNAKDEENAKKMAVAGNAGLQVITLLATQKAQQDEKLMPLVDIAKTLRIVTQNSVVVR